MPTTSRSERRYKTRREMPPVLPGTKSVSTRKHVWVPMYGEIRCDSCQMASDWGGASQPCGGDGRGISNGWKK